MAFLGLCKDDPLVEILRDYFTSTIVLVPEERIRPLCALYYDKRRLAFRGELCHLMKDPLPFVQDGLGTSQMRSLTGKRSRAVGMSLGFKILGSYLGAFGVPTAALRKDLQQASKISFEFHDVYRDFVDVGLLGKALANNRLDLANPANHPILPNEDGVALSQLLAIDSVIRSNNFTVCVEESKSDDFSFNLPVIKDIVSDAGANVSVESTTGRTVSFTGTSRLTFAFSAVHVKLTESGRICSLPMAQVAQPLRAVASDGGHPSGRYSLDRILLTEHPGMLSIDME